MTKLSRKQLPAEEMGNYINNLWSAFTLAHSKQDIRALFKDLFTHTEYKMFAKRFEVARLLLEGEKYEAIQNSIRVTPVTIAKINNILAERGDGLRKAVRSVNKLEDSYRDARRERVKDLENPLRKKLKQKRTTLLGTGIKVGLKILDQKISKSLKNRTAKEKLSI